MADEERRELAAVRSSLEALASTIRGLGERVEALEARQAPGAPQATGAEGPPPRRVRIAPSAYFRGHPPRPPRALPGVAVQKSVLDRLESLESRQESVERKGASIEQDLLARVYKLEVFREGMEVKRLASQRSLEARLDVLEGGLTRSTHPASPGP